MRIQPRYYEDFSCIMDKCKHTCCAGWEIDIDDKTYSKYQGLQCAIGKRIRDNIITDENGHHFILGIDGRCPMLDKNGLCDIIRELGDDWICDICNLHPRFINEFEYHTEIGVGLCCPTAAEMVLGDNAELVREGDENYDLYNVFKLYNGFEGELFTLRNEIFEILKHNAKDARVLILKAADAELPVQKLEKMIDILNKAERLDPSWEELLGRAASKSVEADHLLDGEMGGYWVRLVQYFIFRYLAQAADEFEINDYILFGIVSADIICGISCALKDEYDCIFDALCDISRGYSAEIEYSSENVDIIIEGIYNL